MAAALDNWLAQRAASYPDRTALVGEGRQLSYAELELEARAAARRLAGEGVGEGSIVALAMPAGVDYAVLLHALMTLGAVAQPLDPRLGGAEREAALHGLDVLLLESPDQPSGSPATAPQRRGDPPHRDNGFDPAGVQCRILTSGTSGVRRAVELSYANHLWSAAGSALNLGVEAGDRWLCCLPLFHISGLSIVLRSVIYGTAAEVHDGFDVERVGAALEEESISLISLVSTQLARLLDVGADLSVPRALLIGGGPVPPGLLERAITRGARVVQTYGMTETASQVATLAPLDAKRKLGSAGRPLLTARLRIEDGEILVQGPTVARDCLDPDGWLHTGDLGRVDEDGFLYVTGRRGELIVTGGENVTPAEVEAVLLRHPAVADAAVVGRPDPEWQEAVCAVVVIRDGAQASADDLRGHCAASLAPFKVPKRVEFAERLPRTASGKLLRAQFRG